MTRFRLCTHEEALKLVETRLKDVAGPSGPFVIVARNTIEKPYGWIFFYNSKKYVETGEFRYRLAGNGPIIVNRHTGSVRVLGTVPPPDESIRRYEATLSPAGED